MEKIGPTRNAYVLDTDKQKEYFGQVLFSNCNTKQELKSSQPKAIANSANCVAGLKGNVILKFPLDSEDADPIHHDALMHLMLQETFKDSDLFPKLLHISVVPNVCMNEKGNFIDLTASCSKDARQAFARSVPISEEPVPCIISEAVPQPKTLVGALKELDLSLVAPQLIAILTKIAEAGWSYAFTHGDLHEGNILWNSQTKQFQLIDFGRTNMIPSDDVFRRCVKIINDTIGGPQAMEINNAASPMLLTYKPDSKTISCEQSFPQPGVFRSYCKAQNFNKYTMKEDQSQQFAFIVGAALDIGGLMWYLQYNARDDVNTNRLEDLGKELYNVPALKLIASVNKCKFMNPYTQNTYRVLRSIHDAKEIKDLQEQLDGLRETQAFKPLDAAACVYAQACLNHVLNINAEKLSSYLYESGIWLDEFFDLVIDPNPNPQAKQLIRGGKCRRLRLKSHHESRYQHGGNADIHHIKVSDNRKDRVGRDAVF